MARIGRADVVNRARPIAPRMWRSVEKNRSDFSGLVLGRYPRFILSDRDLDPNEIPVFVFHAVKTPTLEPVLSYLAENRYATLSADDYLERRRRGDRGSEREVVLTFDDGERTLYTDVFPALARFGLRAVAFVVPGLIPEKTSAAHDWQRRLCNWTEIEEMHRSGHVDFQSHSLLHRSISVSSGILDFVRPTANGSFLDSDLWPVSTGGPRFQVAGELAWGVPICNWGSRFSATPAFLEDERVTQACVEQVRSEGGAIFFSRADWFAKLTKTARGARSQYGQPVVETREEQRASILHDLAQSRRILEFRLPGKHVRHFCYPWFRGCRLAAELSAQAGYVSNFWGGVLPDYAARSEPMPVSRLNASYLWRLPGVGRRALSRVLLDRSGIRRLLRRRD